MIISPTLRVARRVLVEKERRDKERGSGVDLRRAESRRGGEASARSVEPPLESQELGVFSVSARPEGSVLCRAERYRHSYSLARAGSWPIPEFF